MYLPGDRLGGISGEISQQTQDTAKRAVQELLAVESEIKKQIAEMVKEAVKEALREQMHPKPLQQQPDLPIGYTILIKDEEAYFVNKPKGLEYPETTNLLSKAKVFPTESEAYGIIQELRSLQFLSTPMGAMSRKYVESMVVQNLY